MKLRAWRAALRIARRDALRAKGRSALVLAMIALPVLGVAGADVAYRSAELDPQEQVVRTMGRADALLTAMDRGTTVLQAPSADDGAYGDSPDRGARPTAEQKLSLATEPAVLAARLMPPGSRLVPYVHGPRASATTRDGRLGVETAEVDLTDPVWHGKVNVVAGRAPSAPHEIAATRAFLDEAGLHVGDTTVLRGLEGARFTVTAIAEYPGDLRTGILIGRPGEIAAPLAKAQGGSSGDSGGSWLVELPRGASLDWSKVLDVNRYGFALTSKAVLLDPPPRSRVPYYAEMDRYGGSMDTTGLVVVGTVVGMALLEIVLLAGPAFAVGARRSRRQLGLLAAGGGDRSHVRAVVLGGGAVLGLAGAVVGVLLAVVLVAVGRPWAEEVAGSRFGHLDLHPLDLFTVALIGLVTGLLAAVVPALQAARQDVVEALTGRGSVKPVSRRLTVVGLVMVAGGAALALLGTATGATGRTAAVAGGSALAELGMVACTPMLVGLFGKLGRHLPLSPRLALRDAVRHRGRTAPAVAAVMAAVAGSVAVGIYTASVDAEQRGHYTATAPAGGVVLSPGYGPSVRDDDLPQLRSAVERTVPGLGPRADVLATHYKGDCHSESGCGWVSVSIPKERRCPATDEDLTPDAQPDDATRRQILRNDPRCRRVYDQLVYGSTGGDVPAGDAVLLRNLYGVTDPAGAQALAAGKAVVFDPLYVKDGRITLNLSDPDTSGPVDKRPPVHQVTVDAVLVSARVPGAEAVLSPQTAQRLGLSTSPAGSVWLPDTAPASSAEQRANAAVARISDGAGIRVERGYQSTQTLTGLALTGFSALVALGAAGIATGLAAADSQHDLATLAAVGATGGIRRRLSGFQCGVIAAMGTVLGTVCGVVPAVALRKLEAGSDPTGITRPAVIVLPWLDLGLTLVVLPLIAVALAMLLTRSKLVLGRRTA